MKLSGTPETNLEHTASSWPRIARDVHGGHLARREDSTGVLTRIHGLCVSSVQILLEALDLRSCRVKGCSALGVIVIDASELSHGLQVFLLPQRSCAFSSACVFLGLLQLLLLGSGMLLYLSQLLLSTSLAWPTCTQSNEDRSALASVMA